MSDPEDFLTGKFTTRQLEDRLRAGLEQLEQTARKLATQGWTLPMLLTPAETHQIVAAGSPEQIDAAFVALYEAPNGDVLDRIVRDLPRTRHPGTLAWSSGAGDLRV